MPPSKKRAARPAISVTVYWPADPKHRFQLGALWPVEHRTPGGLSGRFADPFPGKVTVVGLVLSNGKTLSTKEVALSGINRLRRNFLLKNPASRTPEQEQGVQAFFERNPRLREWKAKGGRR